MNTKRHLEQIIGLVEKVNETTPELSLRIILGSIEWKAREALREITGMRYEQAHKKYLAQIEKIKRDIANDIQKIFACSKCGEDEL